MMTETTEYLDQLEGALRDVPHGVAAEIRAGIAEELAGLAPDAAAVRIAQLGDPADIAREAIAAGGYAPPVAPAAGASRSKKTPVTNTRGFAIAAALTLSFGGFVLPIVGWIVGIALVILSGLWRTWEKVVAIVTPFVLMLIIGLLLMPTFSFGGVESHEASGTGTGTPPGGQNPLVSGMIGLNGWHLAFVVAFLLLPLPGLWLLWRLRGRTPESARA